MRLDLTLFSEAMAVIVCYYAFLYLRGRRGVRVPYIAPEHRPLVVIVIPARNEELVIEQTIRSALDRDYVGPVRVLVIDDASTDRTPEIIDRLALVAPAVRVLHREHEHAGTGKSDVLNHGFRALQRWHAREDPWLVAKSTDEIVLCIVDADGQLSGTALNDATSFFRSPRVGAVQVGVKIRNATTSTLARLQDIEFVGFSHMVQAARDRLGSVGLGGNGQFTRMSALETLGDSPWNSAALTEDLDLGLRLMMKGWRLRFCSSAWVDQQGLATFGAFLRQRTRWAQGHYQCWRHIRPIARSRRLPVVARLDTIAYLGLIAMVMVVTGALGLRVLGYAGLVEPTNSFLPWLGAGPLYRTVTLVLSWLPIWLTLSTYQRHANLRLHRWELPTFCVLFAVYVYCWALATVRAWMRAALRRSNWVKTPREEVRTEVALAGTASRG